MCSEAIESYGNLSYVMTHLHNSSVVSQDDIKASRVGLLYVGDHRSLPKRRAPLKGDDMVHYENRMLPIKKIAYNIASINTYYGKLFITKANYKRNDLGFWLHTKLLQKYVTDDKLKDIVSTTVVTHDANVPRDYGMVGRYTKGFRYKGTIFNFDYPTRFKILGLTSDNVTEKDSVVVGVKAGIPVMMGYDNIIYIANKDRTKLGTVFELLDIDTTKAPIEYCTAKIYKENIPIAVLLSYYIGYTNLLKVLNVTYTTIDTGKRSILAPNQYKIVFSDTTYIVTRDYGQGDLILSGFLGINKPIKEVNVNILNSKSRFTALFTAMGLPIIYVNEIKLMETMYIDPITKQILEMFKYPTSLVGVLLKTVEMLLDDNYVHPNSLEGVVLKGYERISGMMYLELIKALRINMNKSHFGKSKITISPYSVINTINDDSTTVLVDDLNPIASLKQLEDVTYLGIHGRKEETMSASTRVMHKSEIGVISEAVKDSGAVGISSYLSAAPNLNSTRGTSTKLTKSDGWSSKVSTSGMLAPFGIVDDPKRLSNLV